MTRRHAATSASHAIDANLSVGFTKPEKKRLALLLERFTVLKDAINLVSGSSAEYETLAGASEICASRLIAVFVTPGLSEHSESPHFTTLGSQSLKPIRKGAVMPTVNTLTTRRHAATSAKQATDANILVGLKKPEKKRLALLLERFTVLKDAINLVSGSSAEYETLADASEICASRLFPVFLAPGLSKHSESPHLKHTGSKSLGKRKAAHLMRINNTSYSHKPGTGKLDCRVKKKPAHNTH